MAEREAERGRLSEVERRLSRWRRAHGGRGRPIPQALWEAAVEVAGEEGVERTARVLGVDRGRLARRVARGAESAVAAPEPRALSRAGFVEVDAQRVLSRGQVVVRLWGRDGERVEIAVDGGMVDVTAVAQAFWSRGQCSS